MSLARAYYTEAVVVCNFGALGGERSSPPAPRTYFRVVGTKAGDS